MPNLSPFPTSGALQVSPKEAPSALAALAREVCPLACDYPELTHVLANEHLTNRPTANSEHAGKWGLEKRQVTLIRRSLRDMQVKLAIIGVAALKVASTPPQPDRKVLVEVASQQAPPRPSRLVEMWSKLCALLHYTVGLDRRPRGRETFHERVERDGYVFERSGTREYFSVEEDYALRIPLSGVSRSPEAR